MAVSGNLAASSAHVITELLPVSSQNVKQNNTALWKLISSSLLMDSAVLSVLNVSLFTQFMYLSIIMNLHYEAML